MKFSTILTSYNYSQYILEAIESVIKQQGYQSESEIIVIDDGSTDDTKAKLKPYIEKNLIKYFYQPNAGQSSALNLGFLNSSGDIICFLDADDAFCIDKFMCLEEFYKDQSRQVYFHNLEIYGQNITTSLYRNKTDFNIANKSIGDLYKLSEISSVSFFSNSYQFMASTSAITMRRKIAEQIFPISNQFIFYADILLYYLPTLFSEVYYDFRALSRYRLHQESITTVKGKSSKAIELYSQVSMEIRRLDPSPNSLKLRSYRDQVALILEFENLAKSMGACSYLMKSIVFSLYRNSSSVSERLSLMTKLLACWLRQFFPMIHTKLKSILIYSKLAR